MQGNILSCYPVILLSQIILPSDVTSVSRVIFYQVILLSGEVIAVSAVAVVRIQYNVRIRYKTSSWLTLPTLGEQIVILPLHKGNNCIIWPFNTY